MRFGTDGVRGVANIELTATLALDLARAAARVLQPSAVVVGGDSRVSTPMLEAALVAGFASEGVEVHRLGTVPTAAVAFHAARLGAMGAVVSASHNPYHDNGIKLFASGGTKLPDEVEEQIESILGRVSPPSSGPGLVHDCASGPAGDVRMGEYIDHLVSVLEGRDLAGMQVVVDAANGAASNVAGRVFELSGASATVIHDHPDGFNINTACGATDPTGLAADVLVRGADAGIALDGDADRLIAVDEHGNVVDGDHIIAICAEDMRARGVLRDDTVVVTVMTNLGFHLAMRDAGIKVVETAVGDRYVLEALQRGGYSLGGEQSGHVIFHDRASTGDGLLTALTLLDVVARSRRTLSELAAVAMTQLPQVLLNVRVDERVPDVAERMADEIAQAAAELGDTGRVLVRASGTEPLVRVMVEAPTAELAESTARSLADVAHAKFGA